MNVIYEPRGRAAEYAPLAANLYRGCDHACCYCYSPAVLRMKREDFANSAPRNNGIMQKFEKDVIEMERKGDERSVLLSFTCDAYQHLDVHERLTRRALKCLFDHGRNVIILTKGGKRSELPRD